MGYALSKNDTIALALDDDASIGLLLNKQNNIEKKKKKTMKIYENKNGGMIMATRTKQINLFFSLKM